MGANSKIEWTHHTFNPWTGCQKVSAGCTNCYAESWAKRSGVVKWGANGTRRKTSKSNWQQPIKWNREAQEAGERRRVFCASLADVFEDRDDLVLWRHDLFDLIEETPHLDWLLLTKRPEDAWLYLTGMYAGDAPLPNVWLGTSVEDQQRAEERIPQLLKAPAVVRFLSCEPLLGPLDFSAWSHATYGWCDEICTGPDGWEMELDWVIVGGESGVGSRPCEIDWIRGVRDQCRDANVPVFIKQLGAMPVVETVRGEPGPWRRKLGVMTRDSGVMVKALALKDKKGGDWTEWPADLRVRELPTAYQRV